MTLMKQRKLLEKSKEIPNILGYEGRDEIIHKDDLVKNYLMSIKNTINEIGKKAKLASVKLRALKSEKEKNCL